MIRRLENPVVEIGGVAFTSSKCSLKETHHVVMLKSGDLYPYGMNLGFPRSLFFSISYIICVSTILLEDFIYLFIYINSFDNYMSPFRNNLTQIDLIVIRFIFITLFSEIIKNLFTKKLDQYFLIFMKKQ